MFGAFGMTPLAIPGDGIAAGSFSTFLALVRGFAHAPDPPQTGAKWPSSA